MRVGELEPKLQSTIVGIAAYAVEYGLSAEDVESSGTRASMRLSSVRAMVRTRPKRAQGTSHLSDSGENS